MLGTSPRTIGELRQPDCDTSATVRASAVRPIHETPSSVRSSRCRLGTLFAIHGRPFPWGPMICYSAYVTAIVCLIVLLLDDYSSSAKLKALLVSVQTIGPAFSILHPCILIDLVAQIPERMISCGAAALTLNQLSNLPTWRLCSSCCSLCYQEAHH